MTRKIVILNGPNLNLLGKRQPEIYGHETLDDAIRNCIELGNKLDLELEFFQSNSEGEIVDIISRISEKAAGIIINPAAYSHTSVAILDALNVYCGPVLEVHISNIHKREEFRRHSFVSLRADGVIAGFGIQGYELALRRLARILS